MEVKQTGTVLSMPEIIEDKAEYEIIIGDEAYTVESAGKQAVKDYLFIRRGQQVEIEGDISDFRIEVQKAKIDITNVVSTL